MGRVDNGGPWLSVRLTMMLTAIAWATTGNAAPTTTETTLESEATTSMLNEVSTGDNQGGPAVDEASCEGVSLVRRAEWHARAPVLRERQPAPAAFAVIHHTYIPGACATFEACADAMRAMQRSHQDDRRFNDIGYSFLVAGDGRVYEGRGWGVVGAHSPKYNDNGVGVAFIGDFRKETPSEQMLGAAQALLACGVRQGHLQEDYRLLGHRQVRDTECPGDALFALVRSWPRWDAHPPVTAFRNATNTTPAPTTSPPTQ